jgi:predicted chitinase
VEKEGDGYEYEGQGWEQKGGTENWGGEGRTRGHGYKTEEKSASLEYSPMLAGVAFSPQKI